MSATLDKVIADLKAREEMGRATYGTTVDRTDIDRAGWLRYAYEEALDLALYLRRALDEAEATAGAQEACTGTKKRIDA